MERLFFTRSWVWVGKQRSCKLVALDCPVLYAVLCKQRADLCLLQQHPSRTPIAHQLGPVATSRIARWSRWALQPSWTL